jgi:hypothetical protein
LELAKNLTPEPSKRSSLEKLYENYNKLLNNENNWSFVENLSSNKMPKLFYILNE